MNALKPTVWCPSNPFQWHTTIHCAYRWAIKRQPTHIHNILPFSAVWHCDYIVGGGHISRLPAYTETSFHPIVANGMLDLGPSHLLPQILFSHPFNPDGSFHTSVCAPSQWAPVCPPLSLRPLSAEKLAAHREAFVTCSPGWLNAFLSLWFVPCHFPSSHRIFLSHTLFTCEKR